MFKELWYIIVLILLALCGAIFGLLRWQTCEPVPVQYLVFGIGCLLLIAVGMLLTLLILGIITDKEDNDE